MPYRIHLVDIFSQLDKPISTSQSHYLFLLGTDTQFTPKPTIELEDAYLKKTYERGETLSYTARVIAHCLGETQDISITEEASPHSFSSPSVDVVNGPTTFGSEIGERILQGVFLALKAAAEGKTNLILTGHSRGAVEAYLVAHELKRIESALTNTPEKTLYDILLDSPCPYTKAAVRTLCIDAGDQEKRALLQERLSQLTVRPFLIDPVPGDSYYGLPFVAWQDERFYQPLEFDRHELLIFRDERTRCFAPVIPPQMRPLLIPGHHGSGSGNLYNQQFTLKLDGGDASTIQNLVLCKLLYFIHKNTELFSSPIEPFNLSHSELDAITIDFINSSSKDKKRRLVERYTELQQQSDAFLSYANGGYAYLGVEYAKDRSRYIHYQSPNYHALSEVCPPIQGDFINPEHVTLFFDEYIQLDVAKDASPAEIVMLLSNKLTEIILQLNDERLASSEPNEKLIALLRNPDGLEQFLSAIGVLMDAVSQKYLLNHLSIEEKRRLLEVIKQPFEALKTSQEQLKTDDKTILQRIHQLLQRHLQSTLESHYTNILDQFNLMETQIGMYLSPPNEFVNAFITKVLHNENEALSPLKDTLLESSGWNLEQLKARLSEALSQLQQSEDFNEEQKLEANEIVLGYVSELNDYYQCVQDSPWQQLQNIEQLYDTAVDLGFTQGELQSFFADDDSILDGQQLGFRETKLIELAGKIIQRYELDVDTKPEQLSDAFFIKAESQALALSAQKNHEPLQNTDERKINEVIQSQLLPLTTEYLSYLRDKARSLNPEAANNPFQKPLIEPPEFLLAPEKEEYDRIKKQYDITVCLYKTLNSPYLLPHEKTNRFYSSLKESETSLKQHVDPQWKRYVKNCLVAIAVLSTGIVPGLLALGAYSFITKRSPLFFSQSKGNLFFQDCKNKMDEMGIEHEEQSEEEMEIDYEEQSELESLRSGL